MMAPLFPVTSALALLLFPCLLVPQSLYGVLASPYLRIDNTAPSMLVGITAFQAGAEVELNPSLDCPDKPIALTPASDAEAAPVVLRLRVTATDELSGVDRLKHPGGSTIITAPGTAPDVHGFTVGTAPSEGMLKAWPPGRSYSLAFATADRAGNVATCSLSFVVGEAAKTSVRSRTARLRRRPRHTRSALRRAQLHTSEQGQLVAGSRRLLAADDAGAFVLKVWEDSAIIPKTAPSYNVTLDRLLAFSQQPYLPFELQVGFGLSAQITALLQPKSTGAYTFELITNPPQLGTLFIASKELIAIDGAGTGTTNLVAGTTVVLRLDLVDLAPVEGDWWNVAVTWKGPADDAFRVIGDTGPGCPSGFLRTSVGGRCLLALAFDPGLPYSAAVGECQAAGAIIAPVTSLQDAVDLAYTCIQGYGCWVGAKQAKNQPSPAAGWTTAPSNASCPESVPSAAWATGYPVDFFLDGKKTSWVEDGEADCAIVSLEPSRLGGGTLFDAPCGLQLIDGAVCAFPEPCPAKPPVPSPPPALADCPTSFARGYRNGMCLLKLGQKNLTYSNAVALCASRRAILAPMSNADEAYDVIAACGYNSPGTPCWVSLTQKRNSKTPDAGWQTAEDCSGKLTEIGDVHSVFPATQPNDFLNTGTEDNEFQCGDVNQLVGDEFLPVEDNQCGTVLPFAVCALPDGELCPSFPPPAPPSPPPPPPSPVIIVNQPAASRRPSAKGSRSKTLAVTLGVTIPLVALFVAALAGLCFWKQKKRTPVRPPVRGKPTNLLEAAAFKLESRKAREFSAQELLDATNNFDDKMLLGRGGFGSVYKGVLPDKSFIAVKRLHENTGAVDVATENLVAEVSVLSAVSHRNLVRLLGLCIDDGECALVYEFISNGSLDRVLAVGKTDEVFPWDRRRKIIIGTASALLYLHHQCEQKIIHRDIKPANILLDENWEPRLADFGLAKETLYNAEQVTTMLKGTPGYIAPEAWQSTQVTLKSDVYSFGMVVLATISSKFPSYDLSSTGADCVPGLVNAVLFLLEADRMMEIVAPKMVVDEKAAAEIQRFIVVALHCTQPRPEQRPSMDQVYYMLDGSADIPEISLAVTREDVGPTLLGFAPEDSTSGPGYTMTDSSISGAPTTSTMGPSSIASSHGV